MDIFLSKNPSPHLTIPKGTIITRQNYYSKYTCGMFTKK
ncbi:hypothetical protein [Escherichia coli IS25]|nr:hypothetical protein [Escherichia coli]CDK85333.1 hypothetical protein [Escherichia coli IS25]